MALFAKHKEIEFGVGDVIRVAQKIKEGDKKRLQVFEGIVIGIKGREENKSFTVRRIGAQQVGIERIFPIISPTIESIDVVRKGTKGVKQAKLYYIRNKPKREIDKIYTRNAKRGSVNNSVGVSSTLSSRRKKSKK
ncbi:50S ribosomal protein L19 [Candidatus Woesebacteria bacterium RIFCSPLOWO2_01_FULL_37_19]|uniref:50S ribosomal protein L19 n=2 Tax=Candidatus Woeseibacteriota TaxID=1752722 RepID=A0A1F8B5J9_9BACT|nr:MAG: 50S ribosomal protein L19 [Candidatus Woesebacteria bacterium RIFCSPHIGHO2_01_FULL_38_26b]OGM59323.1 MAG: 50S ribosomal protein L19 [Candidatus Woesebacteria bacterium RIFCSPLOWO2_01_FULL_37_19]